MKTESTTSDELVVTDDQLNLAVSKLCQITRESTLDYAIRVGSLVIHYFYAGNMKGWQKRGPKTQSFRRLASHPHLPMSASALYRCVAVYELCERLNVVSRWSRVTVSHLRVVLGLDEQEQCRLMSRANAERWSVQRVEEEARKLGSKSPRHRGRSAGPELLRLARAVEKLARTSALVLDDLPRVESILGDQYESIEQIIQQSVRGLEEARDAIRRRRLDNRSSGAELAVRGLAPRGVERFDAEPGTAREFEPVAAGEETRACR